MVFSYQAQQNVSTIQVQSLGYSIKAIQQMEPYNEYLFILCLYLVLSSYCNVTSDNMI